MEEALVKVLKTFATSLEFAKDKMLSAEETIEWFLNTTELALSENAQKQLVNHLKQLWN